MVNLDGKDYNIGVTNLELNFDVQSSGLGGTLQNFKKIRDVVGTSTSHSFIAEPLSGHRDEFNEFVEAITAPVDTHTITAPYLGSTITYTAQVYSASIPLQSIQGVLNEWGALEVQFVPVEPQRRV